MASSSTAASPSTSSYLPLPTRSTTPTTRAKVLRLLRARLRVPVLSLLLIPALRLPVDRQNLVFALYPFYKSSRVLLSSRRRKRSSSSSSSLVQWLSYWMVYYLSRILEETRIDFYAPSSPLSMTYNHSYLSPRISSLLHTTLAPFSVVLSRLSSGSPSSSTTTIPQRRTPSLAVQLAGSPRRWLVLKSLLLFFAMDDSLQGARWILESIVQPVVGFFAAPDSSTSSLAALADREREQQREDAEVEDHNDESKQLQTPDLSLDQSTATTASSSSSDTSSHGGRRSSGVDVEASDNDNTKANHAAHARRLMIAAGGGGEDRTTWDHTHWG